MLAIYNRSLTRNAGFVTKNCLKSLSSNNSTETYTERQAKKGRHVSPHVAIYKFPVAALSSISNRVTGVILSAGQLLSRLHCPLGTKVFFFRLHRDRRNCTR